MILLFKNGAAAGAERLAAREPSLGSGLRYTIEPASYAYSSRPIFCEGARAAKSCRVRGSFPALFDYFNLERKLA
jgi:hypothetical protein